MQQQNYVNPTVRRISIQNVNIGGNTPFVLIAGPCAIEGEKEALYAAEKLIKITNEKGVGFIYKSSYDKANRTSISSYRGPGLKKGLEILKKVKETFNVPILSDIHKESEILPASEVLDILQVPAFLCRQTDLLVRVAQSGKVVNIKKGQFLAPWDIKNTIVKVESQGNNQILITERGSSFGYNNLVSDFRSLPIMREFGYPVIYDATHSLQLPGGAGTSSSGQRQYVPHLTRAALATGCDGVFMEVHEDPDSAPCDGPNMLKTDDLPDLLDQMVAIDAIAKQAL